MNTYQLSTGILKAKVVRYTEDYVFLELKYKEQKSEFKQLTRDTFDNLDEWINDNYELIRKIN